MSFRIAVTKVTAWFFFKDTPPTEISPLSLHDALPISATDSDSPAQTLTFSLAGTPPAGASIGASKGVFTWTPSEAQGPGSYSLTVRVSDGTANTDATSAIDVTEVNAAPVLSGVPATATIPELAAYAFTATATDSDSPAQTLTFSLAGTPPAGASIE